MIFKNVANQKLPLYLQDSSGNPKTGEAANITAYISVDGETPQTVTGVTEIGGGFYYITPSQAQTNGHLLTWWGMHATYICRGGAAFTSDAYTQARAQALDKLDIAVSSRAPADTALSNTVWTDARAAKLDNLDAAVSSRLAASSYIAPDNASIAAIKSQTDKLSFVGSDVKATLDNEQVTVAVNNDKTGYSLTADYDRAKTALAITEYIAPDNASISAIKTQTDKLQFDSNNYVYAVGVGGGGGTDWTDDEKKQIRYRLGIDGTTTSPQSNTPHLGSTYSTLDDLAAHVSTRLAASDYVPPDNASISEIKTQTDKFSFAGTGPYDVKATLDGEKVTVLANEDKTGYSLATADVSAIADAVWDEATSGHQTAGTYGKTSEWTTTASGVWGHTTRTLTAFGFNVTVDMSQTLPTSPGPGTVGEALKRADTLRFTGAAGEELVLASATVDVDEQAIADAVASQLPTSQVVVQPIVARAIIAAGDGGVIVIDRYERLVASWQILDADLRTHDLRLIVYTDTSTKVAEYSGAEISVTYQEPDSIVSVNGADTKTPPPGKYLWKLTSQTIDRVLLRGRLTVLDAPDAA